MFVQQLINGLAIGSIYALVAVGYSMVYGVLKLINFANNSFMVAAAFMVILLYGRGGVPYWLTIILSLLIFHTHISYFPAVLAGEVLAVAAEYLIYTRIYQDLSRRRLLVFSVAANLCSMVFTM